MSVLPSVSRNKEVSGQSRLNKPPQKSMFVYRILSSYCQNWATGIASSCRFTEVADITIPPADMLISVLGLQADIMAITFCSFHSLLLMISGQYLNMDLLLLLLIWLYNSFIEFWPSQPTLSIFFYLGQGPSSLVLFIFCISFLTSSHQRVFGLPVGLLHMGFQE